MPTLAFPNHITYLKGTPSLKTMVPFDELQNRYCGEPGTPERKEYERRYKKEVNKLLLSHLLRRVKATARQR